MKKLTAIILILAMIFSSVACGEQTEKTDVSKQSPVSSEKQETVAKAATEIEPDTQQTDVPARTTEYDQYDMCYSIAIGEQGIWTPFASAKKVDFTLSDSEILTLSANGATADFTGQKEGQTIITARADEQTATACITVKKPFTSDAEQEGNIPYWVDYFAYALEGLSPELQEEYMMSVGDYMALVLPDKQYDRTFVNMAKAAAMLYPTTYLINNYAALQMDMEQYDEAKKWLLKALEAGDDPTVLTNLAQCEYELGNYDNAMTYAGQAAELEPNYGLAHLVMTCVHLQRGDDILAIETLFKSMRSTYTETTSDLLMDLYRKVLAKANMMDSTGWEKLPDGTATYFDMSLGEMVLTEYHMELLFEAISAGVESNGQDIPANQISLPYPADPQDALLGGDAWGIAAETVNKEVEAMLKSIKGYTVGNAGTEERQAWCLAFLNLYYQYQIYETCNALYGSLSFEETGESGVDREQEEYSLSNLRWDADDELHKTAIAYFNESHRSWLQLEEDLEDAVTLSDELYAKMQDFYRMVAPSDQHQLAYANRRKDMYEEQMRPLLEEYWLKMNAMLGYVKNEHVREMYETRMVAVVNREAYVNPLYHAFGLTIGTGDEKLEIANQYRQRLGLELYKEEYRRAQQNDARILANKTEGGQLKDFNQIKESDAFPMHDIVITIPPFSPIYMKFGTAGEKYMLSYGAFGTEIVKEYDVYTGYLTETIITRTSVLPAGLGELNTLANDLKDIFTAAGGQDFFFGKLTPVGNIPFFDRTKGQGRTYTYNYAGELVDVSTVREDSTSLSWGGLGGTLTTTQTKSQNQVHEGYLSSPWNSDSKMNLSFGGLEISY